MQSLNENILSALRELGQKTRLALENKDADAAQSLLEDGWNLIPDPKECYDITERKIIASIRLMAHSNKPEYALRWINELNNFPPSPIDDEPVFLIGVTHFQLRNLSKAFEYFEKAYVLSKGRCFREEDPKYLKFYLENKKGK